MAPKNTDARRVPAERARVYWDKAQDFYKLMRDATQGGNWNGLGLAAVHCAISATDALLVAKVGLRSSSKEHQDAADLLATRVSLPRAAEQSKRLRHILHQKTLVEYVDKPFRREEALELQKQVERYFGWVQSLMSAWSRSQEEP